MRRPLALLALVFVALGAACENPAQTRTEFSVIGFWSTTDLDTLDIQMTLSETARAINGAGSWVTPTRALAFRVSGARVGRGTSLFFEFGGADNVSFNGEFLQTANDTLTMAGQLWGGAYRGSRVVFVRRRGDG
jgi:hypothetical protein